MKIKRLTIEGLFLISPDVSYDTRGYFFKSFHSSSYKKKGIDFTITQVNHSLTKSKGTIRGMHFQKKPFEEAKVVQCVKGKIYDVVIDLRKKSKTYGKWHAEELSQSNKKALFIPEGLAHGFQTLTDETELLYLMSSEFSPKHAHGVRFDDPSFNIHWPLPPTFLADKDKSWPLFNA